MENLIPKPVSVRQDGGVFTLRAGAGICVEPATEEMVRIGEYLADRLNPATGLRLRVLAGAPLRAHPQTLAPTGEERDGGIALTTVGGDAGLGEEGYELTITPEGVRVAAAQPAGVFWGVQTLRQMLPATAEGSHSRGVPDGDGEDPGLSAVWVAGDDAGRGQALFRGGGGEAADRPDGAIQAEPAAPAPEPTTRGGGSRSSRGPT